MTTSKTHYELHCDSGLGFFKLGGFDSIEQAREAAHKRQSRVEELYKIVSVTVSTFDIPEFTVPAYIPSLEEIAQSIIGYSDGSFHIEWGEDYENLSLDDQHKVEHMVLEEIASCDGCGWHFHVTNLEQYVDTGEVLCSNCMDDKESEMENDDEN